VHKSNMSPNLALVQVDIPHKDIILSFMHELIEKVTNVAHDDHCGFCTIAGLCDMSINHY